MADPETLGVEIRPVTDPGGRRSVLLQFRDGWLIVRPRDARRLATMLVDTADEIDKDLDTP